MRRTRRGLASPQMDLSRPSQARLRPGDVLRVNPTGAQDGRVGPAPGMESHRSTVFGNRRQDTRRGRQRLDPRRHGAGAILFQRASFRAGPLIFPVAPCRRESRPQSRRFKEPLIKSEVPPAMNGQPAERSRKRSMSRNRVRTCAGLDVGWQVEDGLVQTFLRRPRARPVRGRYARGRRERGSPAPTGPRVVPGPMPWRDNRPATAPRIPSGTASSGGLRSAHEVHWRCSARGCRRQRPRSRRNHALQSLMDGVSDARSARPSTPSTSRSAAPGPCSRNSEGSTSSSSSTTGAPSESRTRSTRA